MTNNSLIRKISVLTIVALLLGSLSACGSANLNENEDTANRKKITIGNKEFDEIYFKTGYFLDKASLSETDMCSYLEKTEVIDKPEYIGKCEIPDKENKDCELDKFVFVDITDEDIDKEIERLRNELKMFTPIKSKRATKASDRVTFDISSYDEDTGKANGILYAKDMMAQVGEKQLIPELDALLLDKLPGELYTDSFRAKLKLGTASEYSIMDEPEEVREKWKETMGEEAYNMMMQAYEDSKVTYHVRYVIKKIEEPLAPKYDAAFIAKKTQVGATNDEEFRKEIVKRLDAKQQIKYDYDQIKKLYNIILEKGKFEPTEEAKVWKFSQLIHKDIEKAKQQNRPLEFYFYMSYNMKPIEFVTKLKENIATELKTDLLIDTLKREYNINEIYESDIENWFNDYKVLYELPVDLTYQKYLSAMSYEDMKNETTLWLLMSKLKKGWPTSDKAPENTEESTQPETSDFSDDQLNAITDYFSKQSDFNSELFEKIKKDAEKETQESTEQESQDESTQETQNDIVEESAQETTQE